MSAPRPGIDATAFAALERRVFERPWSASSFRDGTGHLAFRIEELGRCMGFIYGQVIADEAELWRIVVDPTHRRRGLATVLLRSFREACVQRGARAIFLEVGAHNTAAIGFYRALGFCETGRRKGYYGPHEDALLMRLELSEPPIAP